MATGTKIHLKVLHFSEAGCRASPLHYGTLVHAHPGDNEGCGFPVGEHQVETSQLKQRNVLLSVCVLWEVWWAGENDQLY